MRNKVIFISMLAAVAVCFIACNNEPKLKKKTRDLEVRANQWEFDKGANMYFCHFNVEEITSNVYNYGEVSVSHEYNSGKANAYQVALPETTYMQVELDNGDDTTSPYFYQQHLDYAVGVGFVEVFLTISDFYYDDYMPEAMLFRLQLTY